VFVLFGPLITRKGGKKREKKGENAGVITLKGLKWGETRWSTKKPVQKVVVREKDLSNTEQSEGEKKLLLSEKASIT